MIPRPFELHTPATVSEATSLLKNTNDSKALAGGQILAPLMKVRLRSPANIVDLGRIPGLSYVREERNHLLIGSMTTHHEVATSSVIGNNCRTLSETHSQL